MVTGTTTYQTVPGLTLTISLTGSARVNLSTYGAIFQNSFVCCEMGCSTQIFMNNAPISTAIQIYHKTVNTVGIYDQLHWSIITFLNLPAGTYTFDVRTIKIGNYSGYNAGSDATSSSALMAEVFY